MPGASMDVVGPGANAVGTARLEARAIGLARCQGESRLPLIRDLPLPRILPYGDVWDMWQLAWGDGVTFEDRGRQLWFFLATPLLDDPEDRHDIARIRMASLGHDGWRDHGWVFPVGWSPGSREWSGCSVLEDDGRTVTMYFTATGRRGGVRTFEQRLFETRGTLDLSGAEPVLGGWTSPVESVVADGGHYKVADQAEAPRRGIWAFRDPSLFVDPADGTEHLLFAGSAGWTDDELDGVIGIATRAGGKWELRPPLLDAVGVNSELERPHVIHRDGRYYLFWSSHGRRHEPSLGAPTGLYGMVAERFSGPWRPINGSGLVAANPVDSPFQAYCWWVTAEGAVLSFVDYPGATGAEPPTDPAERRAIFGGTVAPIFHLSFKGDTVLPVPMGTQQP